MSTDDVAVPGLVPGVAPMWRDPAFLRQLEYEIHLPADDDGEVLEGFEFVPEPRYKPRPPDDPRWLKIATVVCFLLTIAAFVVIVFHPA